MCRQDGERLGVAGLETDNSPVVRTIRGKVTGAEVEDLNADGSPEVYVYLRDADARGDLVAYSANRKKSLSEIYLPPLADDPAIAEGYRGYDEFAVVESVLARRFPVYKKNDPDGHPTGGLRQVQYKLVAGEASWTLKVDRISTF